MRPTVRLSVFAVCSLGCGRIYFDPNLDAGQGSDLGVVIDSFEVPSYDLEIGINNSCFVNDGAPLCWGYNTNGQVGDGTIMRRLTPTPVANISVATGILSGALFSCAIELGGRVWCWGSADTGKLGNGQTSGDYPTPVMTVGLVDALRISANNNHACALREGGLVACWGYNASGQIGDDMPADRSTPFTIPGLAPMRDVAAGSNHTCAVGVDGSVWCWGMGPLGDGGTAGSRSPQAVPGLADAVAVAAGAEYSCVRHTNGTVSCWGYNDAGQLGSSTNTQELTPVLTTLSEVVDLAAGRDHTCALRANGEVVCFGDNGNGEAGIGTIGGTRVPPTVVTGLPAAAVEIEAGWDHSCARLITNEVWCWGKNDNGELGDNTTMSRGTPAQVILP